MGTHERQDRELQHPVAAGGNWMRGSAGGKRVDIFCSFAFPGFKKLQKSKPYFFTAFYSFFDLGGTVFAFFLLSKKQKAKAVAAQAKPYNCCEVKKIKMKKVHVLENRLADNTVYYYIHKYYLYTGTL